MKKQKQGHVLQLFTATLGHIPGSMDLMNQKLQGFSFGITEEGKNLQLSPVRDAIFAIADSINDGSANCGKLF